METNIYKTQKKHVTKEIKWNLQTIVSMDDSTCNCLIKASLEWYLFKFQGQIKYMCKLL